MIPDTDPDWYANYRREVEADYTWRKKWDALCEEIRFKHGFLKNPPFAIKIWECP